MIIVKYIKKMTNFCFYLSSMMICLSVAIIIIEIILRRFFSSSLYVADEYTGYLLCGVIMMGLASTLREKGHIRMTIFYEFLSMKNKLIVDKIIHIVGFIFLAYLAIVTGNLFWRSAIGGVRAMSLSQTYIAIPQFFMPLGFFVMSLQFFENIYYDFKTK